jgi:hypothetical protein
MTSNLEAFSLGSFNPETKEFSDITYYNLEIKEQPQLQVKNSHIRYAAKGRVLVAAMKPKQQLQQQQGASAKKEIKEKLVNIQDGLPRFGGGTPEELIILPVRLARKQYKNRTISASQVNDLLLKGAKEIESSAPTISAISFSYGKDSRLTHPARQRSTNTIVNSSAKLDTEEGDPPREVEEYIIGKPCQIPGCSYCYQAAEVKTIPDYPSQQQSVFL